MTALRNATAYPHLAGKARGRWAFASLALVLSLNSSAGGQYYFGKLTGSAESPPNESTAIGFADITIDVVANQLYGDVSFSDLVAVATAAHIHCCAAPPTNSPVAVSLPNLPNVTSGSISPPFSLDLTSSASYSSTFLAAHGGTAAGAEAALASALANGQAYVDIHTSVYPGGEIRVFLLANELFANGFDGN